MSGASSIAEVETTLASYAEVVSEAMDEILSSGRPAAYLSELVRDYPHRGGKGIRSALVLAACQAYGGSLREGLGAAVAIELLHNAFLIHDDIEDGSPRRRGRPTLHELHGSALAVNAGDALAMMALLPLRDTGTLGARVTRRLADELISTVRQTTEGQALELGWRRHNVVDLTAADYITLIAKKTCCYTTVTPLRMGALAGSRGTASLTALTNFGFHLGVAFQIRDDLLSLCGHAAEHGKATLDDIREGKRTLMLMHLLAVASAADRDWLVAYLASPETERAPEDIDRIWRLMRDHGSVRFTERYAADIELATSAAFDAAFAEVAESAHLRFIRGLVPYMLARRG